MAQPLTFAPGSLIAGKYRIDSLVGEGGMGVVMAAHHLELDRAVAIKFLLPGVALLGDAAERFRREARAAAKIQSDHVCRVLDVGTLEQGVPYMVMELMEGEDLGQALGSGRRFDVPDAVGFILEAIEAVSLAHAAGIVHRDLKPANLYLARRPDGSHRIKVLDFGISKNTSGTGMPELNLTASRSIIGSPLYMCPEQMMSSRDVDARADTWALGAILYELLTGRPPYEAETLPQLCKALLTESPPRPRDLRPALPEALESAVLRCLEKDRELRWPSVNHLALALAPFAAGSAAVHVDRARRVLEATGASALAPTATSPNAAVPAAMASPTSSTSVQASPMNPVLVENQDAAPAATSAVTQATWGSTQDPIRKSHALRNVALGTSLLGLAVAGYFLAKPTARTQPVSTVQAKVRLPEPSEAKPRPHRVTLSPQSVPTLQAVPTASGPAVSPVPENPARVIITPMQRARVARKNLPKTAAPAKATSTTSLGISDFGGRR